MIKDYYTMEDIEEIHEKSIEVTNNIVNDVVKRCESNNSIDKDTYTLLSCILYDFLTKETKENIQNLLLKYGFSSGGNNEN